MKTILITGSTDGIGFETAIQLAQRGYKVYIHGRNQDKVNNTIKKIRETTPNSQIEGFVCDLSSVNEIKTAVRDFLSKNTTLDVLINNAGVYSKERKLSVDGIELTMAVNHLAPFVLTLALETALKKSTDPRIITVSSIAHYKGQFFDSDFNFEKSWSGYNSYSASKLANVLFTKKLSRLWPWAKCYSLHPGVITTKLLKAGFNVSGDSTSKGAETSVFLATTSNPGPSGAYFDECKIKVSSPASENIELENALWNWSQNISQ